MTETDIKKNSFGMKFTEKQLKLWSRDKNPLQHIIYAHKTKL